MDFTLHSCKIISNSLDSFIMYRCLPQQGLALANELVAEGCTTFTFGEVEKRLGKSKTATANLLKRMENVGLVDRVRRGHYVVRQLGVLGTPACRRKRRIVSRGGTGRRITSHCLSKRPLRERPVGSPDSVHSGRGRTPDSYQVALRLAAAGCYRIARENWGGAYAVGSIPHLRSASRRPGCGKASAARRRDRGIGGGFRRGRFTNWTRRFSWIMPVGWVGQRRCGGWVRSPAPWHWNHSRVSSYPSGPSLRISISNPEPVNPRFGGIADGACAGKDLLMNCWP